MSRRYEFNIEDINSARIVGKGEDEFTVIINRKFDDNGNPLREFTEMYKANCDYSKEESENLIGVICPICGSWLWLDKDKCMKEYEADIVFDDCTEDDMITYDEDQIIDLLQSYMSEEEFSHSLIYINDIHIH